MSGHYASTVLMVAPYGIQFNTQTAESNLFQVKAEAKSIGELRKKAMAEFEALRKELIDCGVDVLSIEKSEIDIELPDAVFPNNWICTLPGGKVVLFPMLAANRRTERKKSIIDAVLSRMQRSYNDVLDLRHLEDEGIYLEGTGSIIFDHERRIAFAAISDRTNEAAFINFCKQLDYKAVAFTALDESGYAIYHTNVLMAVLKDQLVICLSAIKDPEEKKQLTNYCSATGKELIDISFYQMKHFAGNVIQLKNKEGKMVLLMSASARKSFSEIQIKSLEKTSRIVSASIYTIEMLGGGSARCMVSEIFC